jgi:hypothetical protein
MLGAGRAFNVIVRSHLSVSFLEIDCFRILHSYEHSLSNRLFKFNKSSKLSALVEMVRAGTGSMPVNSDDGVLFFIM